MKTSNAFLSGGLIQRNESYEAITLPQKIEAMMRQEEPVSITMEYVSNERRDGVLPQYDIRTNRFEIGHDVMSQAAVAHDKGRDFRRGDTGKPAEETETNADNAANISTPVSAE